MQARKEQYILPPEFYVFCHGSTLEEFVSQMENSNFQTNFKLQFLWIVDDAGNLFITKEKVPIESVLESLKKHNFPQDTYDELSEIYRGRTEWNGEVVFKHGDLTPGISDNGNLATLQNAKYSMKWPHGPYRGIAYAGGEMKYSDLTGRWTVNTLSAFELNRIRMKNVNQKNDCGNTPLDSPCQIAHNCESNAVGIIGRSRQGVEDLKAYVSGQFGLNFCNDKHIGDCVDSKFYTSSDVIKYEMFGRFSNYMMKSVQCGRGIY